MSAGFKISWVEEDRNWAEWVDFHLRDRGFPVHLEYPAGSNRIHDFEQLMRDGCRVIAIVSPDSLADPAVQAEWLHALDVDPDGSERRILPLLTTQCDAGVLRARSPLRLDRGDDSADPADLLRIALGVQEPALAGEPAFPGRSAGERRSLAVIKKLVDQAPGADRPRLASTSDPLPRLRVLSERALAEAGRVGPRLAHGEAFAQGLYVRRDLERPLLEGLSGDGPRLPQCVVGEPGAGKTSLLWGIASRLLVEKDHEVLLVKATWLRSSDTAPALVDAGMIAAAVSGSAGSCTLLIDTVDLVLTSEEGHLALVAAVDTAIEHGASVLMTSRPAEAQLLPLDWKQLRLSHYVDEEAADGGPSEFERAVASHSRFYCSSAESAKKMAGRLLSAVARRQPLGQLCLRPLTLRMLFQLYAPSAVSDNVDVTDLYYSFWNGRVIRDTRDWGAVQDLSDRERDLSATARRLALLMLQAGNPEVPLNASSDPAEEDQLASDVDLLVRRGVGELVADGTGRLFRFFHQTFFEFAAAQALLEVKGVNALGLLEQRVRVRSDDYLLLAVFEQTWLCAWRDRTMAPGASAIAERMLDELLQELQSGSATKSSLPYALQKTLLAVLAQSPTLPDRCRKKLTGVLKVASLQVVRDCLSLMPPPTRRWTEADLRVLTACAGREDAAWIAVVEVVSRLVRRDGELAVRAARALGLVDRAKKLTAKDLASRPEPSRLLADLLPLDTRYALDSLRDLARVADSKGLPNSVATIIRLVLERAEDLADHDLGAWADSAVGDTVDRRQAVILPHAEAHRLNATRLAVRHGWSLVLVELKTALGLVAAGKRVSSVHGALLGGALSALAHDGPEWTVAVVGAMLYATTEPHVHAEVHRGWLVGYTRRAPNPMTQLWADWLVAGLPASHRSPEGQRHRWADTVRRTLEREDVSPTVVGHIAESAATRMPGDPVRRWLEPDSLLRLVIRAAGAGEPHARQAIDLISAGHEVDSLGVRILAQQAELTDSPTELRIVALVLLSRLECGHLDTLLRKNRNFPAEILVPYAGRLVQAVNVGLTSHRVTVRSESARLFQSLVSMGIARPPRWQDLEACLSEATEPATREWLIRIAGLGLDTGHYQAAVARPVLVHWYQKMLAGNTDGDVLAARSVLVATIARWGDPDDAATLLEVAFQAPVEAAVLAKVSSFVRADHRPAAQHLVRDIPFLISFGQLLKNTAKRAKKDTPVRWRGAMTEVLDRATATEQIALLDSFAELEPLFAASIALQLKPRRHPGVRQRMSELLDLPGLDDGIRRNIRLALAEKTSHQAHHDWPELPALLGRSVSSSTDREDGVNGS